MTVTPNTDALSAEMQGLKTLFEEAGASPAEHAELKAAHDEALAEMNARLGDNLDRINENAESVDLIERVDNDPKLVLLGKVDFEAYLRQLRPMVYPSVLDISTKAGRDRIVAKAASVRSRKAEFERTKLALTSHWRDQTAKVNAVGKTIAEKMGALAEEIRAPVTQWEEADKARQAEADRIIADLTFAANVAFGETSQHVQQRLDHIRGINLNPEVLGVRLDMAEDLKADAVAKLTDAVTGLKAQEAQAAELAQLRAEQERQRIANEQAEQERIAKEAAEAAAKAEQDRIERARVEAAEQARRDAEAAAERERIERERAAQAEIDAANARAAEAERAAAAERQRLADLEAARKAAADAEAQEQARREADIAHREKVIDTAAEALTALGLTKKLATSVVNAIASGNVPNVQVVF